MHVYLFVAVAFKQRGKHYAAQCRIIVVGGTKNIDPVFSVHDVIIYFVTLHAGA